MIEKMFSASQVTIPDPDRSIIRKPGSLGQQRSKEESEGVENLMER